MSAAPKLTVHASPPEADAPPASPPPAVQSLPTHGVAADVLLDQLHALRDKDARWKDGKVFALVYDGGEDLKRLLHDAHGVYAAENGLNPMAFRSLKRMEAEVVRMTLDLLHGPKDGVGCMTSGGTESLLLAVKTYRDRARKKKPWIRRPNIVLPKTAHVAFDKAAHYFGVRLKHAPVGKDFRVDVKAMKKLVDRNTIALAASAPQYPHGVVDPIEEIAAFAEKKGLPLHVDACVGGFLLPFIEALGRPVPAWDFRVPGVTSISADLHKYGYCAKGASTLSWRSMDYMRDQFFVTTEWPGGIYAGPGVPGTRPGGPIAAAWAGMQALGREGYLDLTRRSLEAADQLRAGITRMAGVKVLGLPPGPGAYSTIVTIGSDDEKVDIYAVADQLGHRGWHFDRQQHPASIHMTVMAKHLDVADAFLADLEEVVAYVKAHPELKTEGNAAMYGMMAKVPARTLVKGAVQKVMEDMYAPGGEVPDFGDRSQKRGGIVDKILDEHGATLLAGLDKLEQLKARVQRAVGGGR